MGSAFFFSQRRKIFSSSNFAFSLEAILHFAEQIISSGRRGPGHQTDGQGLRPTKDMSCMRWKGCFHIQKPYFIQGALFSSWHLYIYRSKLMKWLHIASKWRIDCVTVQQSMTNCRSNPFNWHGHLSFSYKRKQLLSTQAQQIMPFLGAKLCFGKPFDHFVVSSKLVPVTKLDLSFLELVTVNLKLLIFCI